MARTLKHLSPQIPPGPACVVRRARLDQMSERVDVARLLADYAEESLAGQRLEGDLAMRSVELVARWRDAFVLLATIGEQSVGLAVCLPSISTFAAAGVINIHDLWVDVQFRKRGVAAELLRCVQREAQERGCAKVTLEVLEDNLGARRLYRRSGFRGEPGAGERPGTFFLELAL
jgi:ribosomal protein S18 acetylase RimI-like enzyme